MAESLARAERESEVKTSWKRLTPDFASGKCDVRWASPSHGRQKQVFFADKLDTDGESLVRCTDVKKYSTLEQINKPSVRLLEPAGGANEAFVRLSAE